MPARRDLWLSSRELISAARRSFSPPLIHPAAQQIKVRAAIINSHPNSVIARRFAAFDSVSRGEINRGPPAPLFSGQTRPLAIFWPRLHSPLSRAAPHPPTTIIHAAAARQRSGKVKLMSCSSSGRAALHNYASPR
jgi:hypothetical protein